MTISVGIPCLVRYDLLRRLVTALREQDPVPDRIIVVDNGGNCPEDMDVEIINPGSNIGVAAACNLLNDAAIDADVLIISNDDVLPLPGAVRTLVDALAASVSPLVQGCYLSFFAQRPRELTARVGYFDEAFYPVYYEDADMIRRLMLAGLPAPTVAVPLEHDRETTLASLGEPERKEMRENHFRASLYYYRGKWGEEPGLERFSTAWNGKLPGGWHERCRTRPRQP